MMTLNILQAICDEAFHEIPRSKGAVHDEWLPEGSSWWLGILKVNDSDHIMGKTLSMLKSDNGS